MGDKLEQDNQAQEPGAGADSAWQAALLVLREAMQLGLPAQVARAEIARELAGLAKVLCASTEVAPGLQSKVPTVQVRYFRRRLFPYQVRLDRTLWWQAGSPRNVTLILTPGGWQVVSGWSTEQPEFFVYEDRHGPYIYCTLESLYGLGEGVYRAEVVERAIVIREALGSAGQAE